MMTMSIKAALILGTTTLLTAAASKPALTCDWGCAYGIGAGIGILGALLAPPPVVQQPAVIVVPVPVPTQPQETRYVSPPVSQRVYWCRTSQRWWPDVQTCSVKWSQ